MSEFDYGFEDDAGGAVGDEMSVVREHFQPSDPYADVGGTGDESATVDQYFSGPYGDELDQTEYVDDEETPEPDPFAQFTDQELLDAQARLDWAALTPAQRADIATRTSIANTLQPMLEDVQWANNSRAEREQHAAEREQEQAAQVFAEASAYATDIVRDETRKLGFLNASGTWIEQRAEQLAQQGTAAVMQQSGLDWQQAAEALGPSFAEQCLREASRQASRQAISDNVLKKL